jgi:hypothetical protein
MLYEKPQFSLRQVKLICQRLLKEQEMRLRYEYETVLNKKLEGLLFKTILTTSSHSAYRYTVKTLHHFTEKHDQYVQFAREQLDANAAKKGDDISCDLI